MSISSFSCAACGNDNPGQAAFCMACGAPRASDARDLSGLLFEDQVIKQRYRVLAQVGRGGFAAVYKAEDLQFFHRLVAMKEMSQGGLDAEELTKAIDAFKHEAQMLASLQHPNLPHIYDHFSEKGRWYLVMEFIAGETLESYIQRQPEQRLALAEVLAIGLQLCSVLDYLHTRQPPIIFRDLKPSNIVRTHAAHLYLIDFGIARHFKPGQIRDTIPFGSPGYAAPEQYGKEQTTPQSDIYSLGALLHQMLSGEDPSEKPFRFSPLRLYGVEKLEDLITRMTNLNPEMRPKSISEVQVELKRIGSTAQGAVNQNNWQLQRLPQDRTRSTALATSRERGIVRNGSAATDAVLMEEVRRLRKEVAGYRTRARAARAVQIWANDWAPEQPRERGGWLRTWIAVESCVMAFIIMGMLAQVFPWVNIFAVILMSISLVNLWNFQKWAFPLLIVSYFLNGIFTVIWLSKTSNFSVALISILIFIIMPFIDVIPYKASGLEGQSE